VVEEQMSNDNEDVDEQSVLNCNLQDMQLSA